MIKEKVAVAGHQFLADGKDLRVHVESKKYTLVKLLKSLFESKSNIYPGWLKNDKCGANAADSKTSIWNQ